MIISKHLRLAAVGIAAAALIVPAASLAQSRPAAAQTGVGVANLEAAVAGSTAYQGAVTQIRTTYATQIQQHQTRAQALQTEVNALGQRVQQEQARTPRNEAALQAAGQAYQTRANAAQQELARLSQPFELANAYAREQVSLRLSEAVQAVATARGLGAIVSNEAVFYVAPSADVTTAITAELNRLVPTVSIAVPQGYRPGALMQQRAQGTQPQAPATAPAQQPQTR